MGEWGNGIMGNGGMEEWENGGMGEWRNGGMGGGAEIGERSQQFHTSNAHDFTN